MMAALLSQSDPFNLILRQPFLGPVIELGRARGFVRGHRLGVFERAAIGQIGGDPRRPKTMVANRRHDAGGGGAAAYHPPGVRLAHRPVGQHRRNMPAGGAKQDAFPLLGNAGRRDIGVQCLGQRVVARHRVLLAAFLLQANLPAGTFRPEILHLHFQGGANPRERIGEGGDQRSVPQIAHRLGGDGIQQPPPFVAFKHRRLAGVHDVLGTAHGGGRVVRHDLAGDQPVEQHPHGGELLLHGRRRVGLLHGFDIAGDVIGPDGWQREAARLAPRQKIRAGAGVGPAGVWVADVGGEEIDVAPGGLFAGVGDQRRHTTEVDRVRPSKRN